jgi:CheY-like chemotaxis protein/anti-sigma regulatory factor (Ser/Thr protein kinase)
MPARILIVDDDAATVDLIKAMVEGKSWHLDSAYDGNQALTKVSNSSYDVVLTDINMPGLDGLTLMTKIHEARPETVVVVMTADNAPSNVLGSLRGQAFTYLSKPFSQSALIDVLEMALAAAPEPDDIEVISARPNWISLKLRCKIVTAERLTRFIRELETGLSVQDRELIATAFRELLINAIEHGGHSNPHLEVHLAYIRTGRSIIYYVRDPGPGFSFDALPHAAISTPDDPLRHIHVREAEGMRAGGFGILLTRNFADELIYSEKGNEVVFVKYLS